MSRNIRIGNAYLRDQRTILPPSKGGTGKVNLPEAKAALMMVDKGRIGQPSGPIGLDGNGKISMEYVDMDAINNIVTLEVVEGLVNGEIILNNPVTLRISNYKVGTMYVLSDKSDCSATLTGDTITFIALGEKPRFRINDRIVTFDILVPKVIKPTITSPTSASIVDHTAITISGSEFSYLGVTDETHIGTHYKICIDEAGNNVIWDLYDTVNLTTKNVVLTTPLTGGSVVYIFMRYAGSSIGNSEWSDPVRCTVTSTIKPSITNLGNNAELSNTTHTFTSSSFVTDGVRTHVSTDWKVVLASDTTNVVASSLDNTINLTSWTISTLLANTPLLVMVRYKDSGGVYTEWSDSVPFIVKLVVTKPTITFPTEGYESYSNNFTITASDFEISGDSSTHAYSRWQVARDDSFLDLVVNADDETSYLTSYPCTNLPFNSTLYARVKYVSANGIISDWSNTVSFSISASVATPSITAPTNNFTLSDGLDEYTFISSAFDNNGSDSTHAKTTWQVSTGSDFNTYLVNETSTTKLTSYTVTGLSFNTTYYVRVKYEASNTGVSLWSNVVTFKTGGPAVQDGSGRSFYRHSSGMGTVMTWKDKSNVTHNTLVLDASYRNQLPWANPSNYIFDVSGLTKYGNLWYYLCSGTTSRTSTDANTRDAATESAFYFRNKTDAQINALSGYFEDAGTSKNNTTNMMANSNLSSTAYAAGFCRSKKVNGVACDLPNIQTLIRVYCSMFKLDELDPTANGNRFLFTKARSNNGYNWYPNNATDAVWSSSGYSSSGAWRVYYAGYTLNNYKTYSSGVVPVLEL